MVTEWRMIGEKKNIIRFPWGGDDSSHSAAHLDWEGSDVVYIWMANPATPAFQLHNW